MFEIGDKIVYPMYGAGVIEAFDKKTIDGKLCLYYVLNIPIGSLKIMISANKAEKFGLRAVSAYDEILGIINAASIIDMPDNWNIRYKENLERIKSGDLRRVAEVFKTLLFRERKKTLSSAEKKMLSTAKQIILSEIIVSLDIEKSVAEKMLEESILVSA